MTDASVRAHSDSLKVVEVEPGMWCIEGPDADLGPFDTEQEAEETRLVMTMRAVCNAVNEAMEAEDDNLIHLALCDFEDNCTVARIEKLLDMAKR